MTIHVTPIPSTIELVAPAFTLGTANTAGSSTSAVASDSTLLVFDATVPTTIAYSATAAAGTAVVSARRDHTHGMPSDAGVAKAWCRITAPGALASPSYGIESIGDTSTGVRLINWTTDFSSVIYSAVCTLAEAAAVGGDEDGEFRNFAVGSVTHTVFDGASVADKATSVAAYGNQ